MSPKYWDRKCDNTVKKIKVEDAVGSLLAHDVTEVRPGDFKGAAFSAGHRVSEDDLCHLRQLGKRHIFVLDLDYDQVHENDAALRLASALLGSGMNFEPRPKEGKIQFEAIRCGLFKVNSKTLFELNMIPEVICASIHNNTSVAAGSVLTAVRIMPLFIDSSLLKQATDLIYANEPTFEVKPFRTLRVRLIITGNEVYDGLIEDGFEAVIKAKLNHYNLDILETVILPDDAEQIACMVKVFLDSGTDLLITTGGMSVDPDDVTRFGIEMACPDRVYYGAAVTPGAMFQLAYFGSIAAIGIPACALYHKTTIFDLILPRLLVGEKPNDEDLARLAHGGMCLSCKICVYPQCPFGKI